MTRLGVIVPAAGLAMALATSALADKAPESSPGTAVAIMQATAAIQTNDCAAAKGPLNQLWNDPYLENSDPVLAAQMRAALIACVAQTDGLKAAIALSADNIKRPAATVAAYDMHAFLQLLDGQVQPAAATLDITLAKFPDTATDVTDLTVIGVLVMIHDSDPVHVQALLNRLEEVRWQAHSPALRPLIGILRVEGLRTALKSGDDAHVALYRADIARDSLIYVMSQSDGELSDGAVPAADVRPIITAEIRDAETYVAQNPTALSVLSYLMSLERMGDQDSLALTQLNGIFALIDQYGVQNFQDIESYPGLLATKVDLLADLGRQAEADKAYADGAARLTPLGAVDLNLTYMSYLIDRGEDKAALAFAPKFAGVSLTDAQRQHLYANLACAYAYQGDEPDYVQAVTALGDAPLMRVKPALCAGDSDGAAAALIAAINSGDMRLGAAMYLQTGLVPLAKGDRDRLLDERLKAVKGRPDVVAAAQAAHINLRSWPLRF